MVAYVKNSQSTSVGEPKNSIGPRIGAEVGYLCTNGIVLNMEYDHLFSN